TAPKTATRERTRQRRATSSRLKLVIFSHGTGLCSTSLQTSSTSVRKVTLSSRSPYNGINGIIRCKICGGCGAAISGACPSMTRRRFDPERCSPTIKLASMCAPHEVLHNVDEPTKCRERLGGALRTLHSATPLSHLL